jgi:hypothetical protein
MPQFSFNWNLALQIALLAAQILLPVFSPLSQAQHAAIATFIGAVQAVLGFKAQTVDMEGKKLPPSVPEPPKVA